MRNPIRLLLSAALAVSLPLSAQEDAELVVKVSPLPAPLHLLQGRGGNVVASVGEDGVLIIDDDYTNYAPVYAETLKGLAAAGEATPRFVLNTHWHFDHTGGNAFWGERGAVIVAHDNVYQRMSTRQEMKAMNRVVEPSPRPALPVVTYADSLALRFNGTTIEAQYYPSGHTDGDSVVYFVEQNVVHMGDHFFKDRFPFVDLGSGGSVGGYLNNVRAVLKRIDTNTVVVPGHGDLATRADLRSYVGMLEATIGLVNDRLDDGASVDEIVAEGLGNKWDSWGAGFIDEAKWIRTIAASR
ncbi:MBL fold metallo-hydrolase [Parahaliea maris]|uniref:MBL fold metallo-hydrolase n=1 Tax=Parahaliea maris TaxID=2716870 RepID=A0A5C9AAK7_9GAMM|nr:MBL fold metallo-hydrolase [Parahaliea maris]TXS96680.1 MBL fold metallo-hydrolase [Parahaliea maris]